MGKTNTEHSTLVAGLFIEVVQNRGHVIARVPGGTLTGIATRNLDGKKMLVTNRHVVSKSMYSDPMSADEMHQITTKVGTDFVWVPVDNDDDPHNEVDLAVCVMVEHDETLMADFTLHDDPHSNRKIIEGTIDPWAGQNLVYLGGVSGEREITVSKINQSEPW